MKKLPYLPLEPHFWDCLDTERDLLKGLALWIVALASLLSILGPTEGPLPWTDTVSEGCISASTCPADEELQEANSQELAMRLTMLAP